MYSTNILKLCLLLILPSLPVFAESDKQMQDKVLRARESLQRDHTSHQADAGKGPDFRGVYYGYYPCKEPDCSGIKITLSLKRNNNYLLVTQPAKPSSREFFEKGKFTWSDVTQKVTLTPRGKSNPHHFKIEDESTLIQLNANGSDIAGDKEAYTLRRSDTTKSREVHIH